MVLYQQQDDDSYRVISYASHSLSKSEHNYDAHKLEFLALKWSVTERFHEYLYGGTFKVFTDNNPLTYILTSAKLNATGQRWIASLAQYNFKIFDKAGKLNLDADALSWIPWEFTQSSYTPLDTVLAHCTLLLPKLTEKVPPLPNAILSACELVIQNDLKLSKAQWKYKQNLDFSIKRICTLLLSKKLQSYQALKTDPDDLKCMLRSRKDFYLDTHLLYRKAFFKNSNKIVNQFVMPQQFRKRTVLTCHEDYGHLGMDRVLILLQERFYWPKMSDDVRKCIRTCEHCVHFKQVPEHDEMYPISASYPLELIHLDFLTIGGKRDHMRNVLVSLITLLIMRNVTLLNIKLLKQ